MSITEGTVLKVVAVAAWTDGNLNMNVFNAVITGGTPPYDAADVVADALEWVDEMFANLVSVVSVDLDGSQVQVYEYDSTDDDWDEVGATQWTWAPTADDDQLPRGVAALINAKSINPDASGRKYIGGLGETNNEDGLWSAALITILEAFATDWITSFVGGSSGASWAPVIWSVVQKTPWLMAGTALLGTVPSYQRRRKRGVGV
jgi:hypothetical protein